MTQSDTGNEDLYEMADEVHDRDSFLAFARALMEDYVDEVKKTETEPIDPFGRGPKGWENHTIEDFLWAAIRWAEDTVDYDENYPEKRFRFGKRFPKTSKWRSFARFLHAGKVYE